MIKLIQTVTPDETTFLVTGLDYENYHIRPNEVARIGSEIFFVESTPFAGEFAALVVWRGLGGALTYEHGAGTPIEPLGPIEESQEATWYKRWTYHPHEAQVIKVGEHERAEQPGDECRSQLLSDCDGIVAVGPDGSADFS